MSTSKLEKEERKLRSYVEDCRTAVWQLSEVLKRSPKFFLDNVRERATKKFYAYNYDQIYFRNKGLNDLGIQVCVYVCVYVCVHLCFNDIIVTVNSRFWSYFYSYKA